MGKGRGYRLGKEFRPFAHLLFLLSPVIYYMWYNAMVLCIVESSDVIFDQLGIHLGNIIVLTCVLKMWCYPCAFYIFDCFNTALGRHIQCYHFVVNNVIFDHVCNCLCII